MRIATAGVRTGFAMTGFCREYGERIPQSALPPLGKGTMGDGGCGLPRPVCELVSQ